MKKIIIALFVTMLLFSANSVVEAKGQKDFKKFWKEFQTAVKKKDKKQILSMTYEKYFAYDFRSEVLEFYPKGKLFSSTVAELWLDAKYSTRKELLSINTYSIYKAKEDENFENALYKELPEIKNKKLYFIDLNNAEHGDQENFIFVEINSKYFFIGFGYTG